MWSIIAKETTNEDNKKIKTYGVKQGNVIVQDISVNKERMESFVERLNCNQASAVHIYELIEDFFGE